MTLLFCDSFDGYDVFSRKYSRITSGTTVESISAIGRFGNGWSMTQSGAGTSSVQLERVVGGTAATMIVGCAFRFSDVAGNITAGAIFEFREGVTLHVDLRITTAGTLQVTRNGTALGTGTTVLANNTWYYLEFKCSISDTTGTPVVHINGVNESITWVTGTGTTQDTKNGGTGFVDRVRFGRVNVTGSSGYNGRFDDLYICDTAGSTNNDFLGDCRVEALFPNGNGNTSNLVGSDSNSTDNYLLVDETGTAAPDISDYVASATANDKDTYAFTNLTPTSGTVYGLMPWISAQKSDAGARSVNSIARTSGTEVDASATALSTTLTAIGDVRETKPGGGAWSISDVNGSEFGVKVT